MTQLYLSPIGILLQQLSNIGQPAAGGLVNVYVAGTVSTPVTTYTDSTGNTANAQPIVLNSAGRMASAAGAPVSVWVPANTPHKMVLTDSAGNLLSGGASMDNLLGINDPTAALASLINPASGSGADLVANAMRSYDVFASMRAAKVPSLAAGQTLIVLAEGAITVGDGLGGAFYWSTSSGASDDGQNVIKPTTAGATGRYLRLQNYSGSFIGTTTDVTAGTTTGAIFFTVSGNQVTLSNNVTYTGTSASITFNITGMPAALQPARIQNISGLIPGAVDNTTGCLAAAQISGGNISFFKVAAGGSSTGNWTASGTKTVPPFTFTYLLN